MRWCLLLLLLFLPSCRPETRSEFACAALPVKKTSQSAGHKSKRSVQQPVVPVVREGDKDRFVICLDPGHGGSDPGTRLKKPPYLCEKMLALDLVFAVEKQLLPYGYTTILTRRADQVVSLPDRVLMAEQQKALLFVSIHFNWAKNTECRGTEIFFFDKKNDLRSALSKKAAEILLKQILASTTLPSRGVKHGNFCVLRETAMPAVLIEVGFFSNPKDARSLRQKNYRAKIAQAIAKGIDEFCRLDR